MTCARMGASLGRADRSVSAGQQRAAAAAMLASVLVNQPDEAAALHNKALCETVAGDYDEAVRLLKDALRCRPTVEWQLDLGAVLYAARRYSESASAFLKAIEGGLETGETWLNAGFALQGGGQARRAVRAYERAVLLGADETRACAAKAIALLQLRNSKQALRVLKPLLEANPRDLRLQELMASAYILEKRYDLALRQCREAESTSGGERRSRESLFFGLWLTGQIDECVELGRSLLPGSSAAFHVSYLTSVDHSNGDATVSRSAWELWDKTHNSNAARVPRPAAPLDPSRVLRVGYVVDEFHRFPDWHFVPPLVENRDREGFFSIGYVTKSVRANYHRTIDRSFDLVRDMRGYEPGEAASHMVKDKLDLLVNTSWSQRCHHLQIFAHRPAAVQIEIPVYPGTTGAAATDFIFTDQWVCPDGAESMYSERVYRLADSYMPWQPPPQAPDVSPPPIERNGYCTFGLFQKPIKLNKTMWDSIAEILRRAVNARLLIHQDSRDIEHKSSETTRRYLSELGSRGIGYKRISFVGARPLARHYEIVGEADIALDTFPYNGTTTTGDCLWMGVPVITCSGRTHASRVGYSMLARVGLSELVATSVAEYVDKAVSLAGSRKRIASYRKELRGRMRESPLTSGRTVMAGIEKAYRAIWKDYCERKEKL